MKSIEEFSPQQHPGLPGHCFLFNPSQKSPGFSPRNFTPVTDLPLLENRREFPSPQKDIVNLYRFG